MSNYQSQEKIQVIDVVRGISILWVMTAHFFIILPALKGSSIENTSIFNALSYHLRSGRYGVTIFFVVSGFLITRLISNQLGGLFNFHLKEFYARRVGRIFPLLVASVLLGAIVRYLPHADSPQTIQILGLNSQELGPFFWGSIVLFQYNWYLLLHHVRGLHWEVLWSLSIEEQFYLFYPALLLFLGTTKKLIRVLAGLILFGIIFRFLAFQHQNLAVYSSFGNFDAIAFGVLLFIYSQKYQDALRKKLMLSRFLCFLGFVVLTATLFYTNPYENKNFGSTLVSVGTFLFLFGGLQLDVFNKKIFKAFSFLGRLSYGCYLLHPLVLLFLWPVMQGIQWETAYGLFLLAVLIVAYCSNRWFELPMNHVVRRLMI